MESLSLISIIVLALTALGSLSLCYYYLAVFMALGRKQTELKRSEPKPVSVVICARNERVNLERFLPLILNQEHPDFEVVVVDDASYDGTAEFLSDLATQHPQLNIVTITAEQKRTAGKKMALTLGFKRASKDIFLLTDADCSPASKHWISGMTNGMKDGIVLGYGGYERRKGLLNLLIRFDTYSTAVMFLSAALRGRAYMGVGRNMAYTRGHYYDNGGFKSHYHIMSGDDDLMVNHTADKGNVTIRINEPTHTLSIPKVNWKKWFDQKRRHMYVSKIYTSRSKSFLGIYHFAQLIFYVGLILLAVLGVDWKWLFGIYALKTTIHLLISIPHTQLLKENEMLVLLPFLEPVMLSINVILGLWSRIRRPTAWK